MKISQSKDKLILLIILAVVQAIILVWVGIYTKEEAVKYIDEGAYFLQHHTFSQPKYLFYSTYVAINSFFRLTGIGVIGVYISQLLINGIATICFYRFNLHISSNRAVSFLAALLLILCVPFQKWTAYLFTESIFFSLIILYLYVLFVPAFPARVRFALSFLLFILIILSRPTGLLIIPATVAIVCLQLIARRRLFLMGLILFVGLAGFFWITNVAMHGQGEFDFLKPFVEEHLVCGYPQSPGNMIPPGGNSISGVADYISNHFIQFIGLASKRILLFFGLLRPYFSAKHNLYLACYFYPLYFFAIAGIKDIYKRSKPFFWFSIAMVAVFTFSVSVTCDDWHNRFIMPLMPIIFVFAANGVFTMVDSIISRRRSTSRINSRR